MKHDDKTIVLLRKEGYSFCTNITLRAKTKEKLVEKIRHGEKSNHLKR